MIKFERLPEDILSKLRDAQAFLDENPKVLFAYLFGGLAKGAQGPLSDVDIAVFLTPQADFAAAKLELVGQLIDILSTDELDLVVLNTASLPISAEILRNKRLLTDKDPFFRHKFESLTLRKYFDFSIKESAIFNRRYQLGR
jgi:uncharacterized protein